MPYPAVQTRLDEATNATLMKLASESGHTASSLTRHLIKTHPAIVAAAQADNTTA